MQSLLRISQLISDFPEIAELDVNPLVVFETGSGAIAIDCRILLRPDNPATVTSPNLHSG
jgi:acetyltransferase